MSDLHPYSGCGGGPYKYRKRHTVCPGGLIGVTEKWSVTNAEGEIVGRRHFKAHARNSIANYKNRELCSVANRLLGHLSL